MAGLARIQKIGMRTCKRRAFGSFASTAVGFGGNPRPSESEEPREASVSEERADAPDLFELRVIMDSVYERSLFEHRLNQFFSDLGWIRF